MRDIEIVERLRLAIGIKDRGLRICAEGAVPFALFLPFSVFDKITTNITRVILGDRGKGAKTPDGHRSIA